ncbi:MAG TPA: cytochrome c-type biogenesis protein CcmH [Longimicrobiaceae bacterium]|nr:cytochrome c-type biogenesis protein CcmH [Longimicrobiaceae bacterium]
MALLLLLVLTGPALAQSPAVQRPPSHPDSDVARAAIGQLRSPYCPGLMLEVCPSGQAEMLRDSIRMLAQEGRSASHIVEWMIANHGEEWRAVPKRSGAGLWAWVLPPLALLFGVGVVAAKLRSMRSREETVGSESAEMTEADRDRLATALREWEHAEETGE